MTDVIRFNIYIYDLSGTCYTFCCLLQCIVHQDISVVVIAVDGNAHVLDYFVVVYKYRREVADILDSL